MRKKASQKPDQSTEKSIYHKGGEWIGGIGATIVEAKDTVVDFVSEESTVIKKAAKKVAKRFKKTAKKAPIRKAAVKKNASRSAKKSAAKKTTKKSVKKTVKRPSSKKRR